MATLSSLQISDNRIDELSTQMFQLQLSSSGDSTELAPLAEPLTEFTLFPKLAAELRLKIWKLALPMPDKRFRRMIQVKGWVSTILKARDYSRFTLEQNPHSETILDLGMSGANYESRQVYISAFPNTLQTNKKGVIRYSDEDIIYVSNMDILMADQYKRTAIAYNHQFEHLFNTVQHLALPIHCFLKGSYMSPMPQYRYGNLILDLAHLRGLGGVLDYAWYKYPADEKKKEAKQRSLSNKWRKELVEVQKELNWHWFHRGVKRGVPAFGLMGTDGSLMHGWSIYKRATIPM